MHWFIIPFDFLPRMCGTSYINPLLCDNYYCYLEKGYRASLLDVFTPRFNSINLNWLIERDHSIYVCSWENILEL